MAGTPNPSIDELLELDDLVNGDIGAAQQEVVDRLRALLPGLVTAKNTAKGWVGPDAMRVPMAGDIDIAPTEITAKHKKQILVAMSESTEPEGIGGGFRNFWTVGVTLVDDRADRPQQIKTYWRAAECVKTAMRAFLNGCASSEGKLLWKSCVPDSMVFDNDLDMSTVMVTFRMVQPPSYGSGY